MKSIDKAIAIIGTQAQLAKLLKVSRAAVGQWRLPGRKVPAIHCPEIEKHTKGEVCCEELRPDIDWAFVRSNPYNCLDKSSHTKSSKTKKKAA